MEVEKITGRTNNEAKKLCVGRKSGVGNIFYKAANRTYKDRYVAGFLIRGPTLFGN